MSQLRENNIVKSFLQRSVIAMIITSIISAVGIYYYQNISFTNSLADNIKKHVDQDLYKYNDNLRLTNKEVLKSDIKHFMQQLDFISVEVYDKDREEFFDVEAKGKRYQEKMTLLKNHDKYLIHDFPSDDKMTYNFFELPGEHYFIQIFYPIYKNDTRIGYIEGISHLNTTMVNRFKRGIIATILTVFVTILIFSSVIFPIVYFAYQKLNQNRLALLSSNIMTINTLGNAIALRDSDTNEHNYRVTIYAIKLAQHINLDKNRTKELIKGAFLHDVGKIGISDNVLLKNGKLTFEEFEIMKEHVNKGVSLIAGNEWLNDSIDVIQYHHEKFDGSGYMSGLKGEEIPITARIFSIVDVFDALTSKRPYKEPFSYEKSIEILQESSNSHFDPKLLVSFFEISNELHQNIRLQSPDELKLLLDNLIKNYFLDN